MKRRFRRRRNLKRFIYHLLPLHMSFREMVSVLCTDEIVIREIFVLGNYNKRILICVSINENL